MNVYTHLLLALTLLTPGARADDYIIKSKSGYTKVQALVSLIKDPKTPVYRCKQVELSPKATIRNKKVTK
jgi:hypothetical protein